MPKRYRLLYDPQAFHDLEEISDYIRVDDPAAAQRWVERMAKRLSRLAHFPLLGVVPKDPHLQRKGYRVLVVDDYLAFYVVRGRTVRVRRVVHGAWRYSFLL